MPKLCLVMCQGGLKVRGVFISHSMVYAIPGWWTIVYVCQTAGRSEGSLGLEIRLSLAISS
jgi:hypothetical protein